MEKYRNYLNAFNAFITSFNIYKYNKCYNELVGTKQNTEDLKDLKKKAATLLAEYKKIPEALQLPEIENKINEALTL